MISDRNRILDNIIENGEFLNDIFLNDNIGIIAGRMFSKTVLSINLILNYINSFDDDIHILSMTRESLKDRMNQVGGYYKRFYNINLPYKSKDITEYTASTSKCIDVLQGGRKINLIFIDEIFYFKFTDYEMLTFFNIIKQRDIKIIFNGTIPEWTKKEYIDKLNKHIDYILVDEKIINNLRRYNINSKLKKVISRIDGQEENCSYICR
jgi:hypothetical protein